jgi:hypothetical protein
MSKFIWEADERLRPGDAPPRPRTTRDLLRVLDVEDADEAIQYQAVRAWLYDHDADPLLQVSLVEDGFVPRLASADPELKPLNRETFIYFGGPSLTEALVLSIQTEPHRREPPDRVLNGSGDGDEPTATPADLFSVSS